MWILGNNFLHNYYTIYDVENYRIGLVPSNLANSVNIETKWILLLFVVFVLQIHSVRQICRPANPSLHLPSPPELSQFVSFSVNWTVAFQSLVQCYTLFFDTCPVFPQFPQRLFPFLGLLFAAAFCFAVAIYFLEIYFLNAPGGSY